MKPPLRTGHKIKVLRIIARLNIGGPAIHVVNLNAGLDPSRFEEVLVSGTENPGEGSMFDYALSRGVKPIIVPEMVGQASFGVSDVKALAKLYRLIRRERPHIVHTHTAKAGFLGRLAARFAGVPVVIHTYHGHVLHGYYGSIMSWLLRRMEGTLARITDRIVAVSEQVKQDLVAYGVASPKKISVIALGFDLEPFLHSLEQRGEFRRELGLNDGIRLVGIIGRIFPIKNHRLFLDAAARVAFEDPNARFVVVGDGVLRPAMERHARELGLTERVVFTGWRRDLARIYADLDVLVISSDNEGTPVSAIEAMASGRPVVATRVGGLPDLIAEGETGYLVPAREAHAMGAAILRLLREPQTARCMGQAAQAMAQERFPVTRLITDMQDLNNQLLGAQDVSNGRSTGNA
jgi:glycosyltransferase involved in cell wall biosynthesis